MKRIFFFALQALFIPYVFSQESIFKKEQVDINFGVGFITPLFDLEELSVKTTVPPLILTIDKGITNEISIGAYFAHSKSSVYQNLYDNNGNIYYGKSSTLRHFIIGGRLLYHFPVLKKADVYCGGMLGYNVFKEKEEPNVLLIAGPSKLKAFTYSILGGIRYKLAPAIGLYSELGYGVTVVSIGLNFSF
ncbi:MAG: hypothetical protein J0L56_14390 [Chitinophagales bacterium]|nr:hypothetical protein [Chitinophagales bacterium]